MPECTASPTESATSLAHSLKVRPSTCDSCEKYIGARSRSHFYLLLSEETLGQMRDEEAVLKLCGAECLSAEVQRLVGNGA